MQMRVDCPALQDCAYLLADINLAASGHHYPVPIFSIGIEIQQTLFLHSL